MMEWSKLFYLMFLVFPVVVLSDIIYPPEPVEPMEPNYKINFTSANNSELLASLSSAEAVDLCFLVDITGSMDAYIQGVKESIRGVVDQLTNTTGRDTPLINRLRLSFVGYRDFGDDDRFEVLSFTPKVSKFLNFLNKVEAKGGGDTPEDVFGGLEKVAEREWSENALRVLFHMADAPCHHERCGKDAGQDPLNRTAEELFKPFKELGIVYNFGQINTDTQPMIKWFQESYGEDISVFDLNLGGAYERHGEFAGYADLSEDSGYAGPGAASPKRSKKVGDAYLGAVLTSMKKESS